MAKWETAKWEDTVLAHIFTGLLQTG